MHTIYHTEAFVLKSIPSGEASVRIWLFTREFGVVVAAVQGGRNPASKLRPHLVQYSLVTVDLVKGRDVWRLIGACVVSNPFAGAYDESLGRSFVRALGLVGRLCIEEGPESELFDHLLEVSTVLSASSMSSALFDAVVLWKILILLGYLELPSEREALFRTALADISEDTDSLTKSLVRDVTEAIERTHL